MENRSPLLSQVNFSKRLYEKRKLTPLLEPTAPSHALIVYNSAIACSDWLVLSELTQLGKPKCL